jgi:hypothetical protein
VSHVVNHRRSARANALADFVPVNGVSGSQQGASASQ